MTNRIRLIPALLLLLLSCRKDQRSPVPSPAGDTGLTLQEVKAAFHADTALTPHWANAKQEIYNGHSYWQVAIDGRPSFQHLQLGYRKLIFYRDSLGKISERILEIIPTALYVQRQTKNIDRDFTGRIFVFDAHYHFLHGKTYLDGRQVGRIRKSSNIKKGLQVDMLAPVTECGWVDNNYVDGDGNAVIYSEQICATSYVDLGGPSGGDFGGSDPWGNSGFPPLTGGGGGPAAAPPPSNLPGENKNGIQPRSYMDCFNNIPDQGAQMQITIYVQEPWPGTDFNIGPNSVGHTAIGLTKTNGSNSITQTVGFYPDATGLDKLHAPSKLVDNGGDLEYNVSISYTVSAENFNLIRDYISSPPAVYDLTNFNCTSFVYNACLAGHITPPDPNTYTIMDGMGVTPHMAPAGLGTSIEKLKGAANVNTKGGNIPLSHGPCK